MFFSQLFFATVVYLRSETDKICSKIILKNFQMKTKQYHHYFKTHKQQKQNMILISAFLNTWTNKMYIFCEESK